MVDAPVRGSLPEATAGRLAALGEALALGDTLGLDRPTVLDVLAETPIGATVRAKRPNIEAESYPPNFKLRHALKDLRLATQTTDGERLELTAAARNWLQQASANGAADLDICAVVATIAAAVSGSDSAYAGATAPSDATGHP